VNVADSILLKVFTKRGFRETWPARLSAVTDIYDHLYIDELERADEIVWASALVSNGGQHRVFSVNQGSYGAIETL